jgi:hypothetical protein
MTKAYDFSALALKLKEKGLDVAEDAVKLVVSESFDWISESAKLSATPWDDMALIIMPKIKELALVEADKIDGKLG